MARIVVRVQPGARRERVIGRMADGTLKIAVQAPPEGGRANEALVRLVAAALGVAAKDVTVVRGHASRSKVLEVADLGDDELAARVERALAAPDGET